MRAQLGTARDLGVRTFAFQVTYLAAAAVASRMGTAHVAAHQIALQLWTFLALVMDSVAIAAQSLIGEHLGAGDREGRARRRAGWPSSAPCSASSSRSSSPPAGT